MSLRKRSQFPQAARKGSLLALTLWALCFLSVLGLHMSLGVRQKMSLVKTLASRDNLYYIADTGIKRAVFELSKDLTLQDSLIESWSNNPGAFKGIKAGIGQCDVYYEFINTEGQNEQRFGLVDEERKININKAKLSVIKRLINQVLSYDDTRAQDLAASIVDWRDSDSFLSLPNLPDTS